MTGNNVQAQMLCGNKKVAEARHHLGSKAGSIHARKEGSLGALIVAVRQRGRAAEQACCRNDLLHVCCRHADLRVSGAAIRGPHLLQQGEIREVLLLQCVRKKLDWLSRRAARIVSPILSVGTLTCRLRHSLLSETIFQGSFSGASWQTTADLEN